MAKSKVIVFGAAPVESGRVNSTELMSESCPIGSQKLVMSLRMQFIRQKKFETPVFFTRESKVGHRNLLKKKLAFVMVIGKFVKTN